MTRGPKRNQDREAEILSLIQSGKSDVEIAKHFGFGRERARQLRKRLGQPPSTCRTPDAVRDKVAELYLQGMSYRNIEKQVGISSYLVCFILKEKGIIGAKRPYFNPSWPKERAQRTLQIVDEYVRGVPSKEIAAKYGISLAVPAAKASRMGLRRGSPSPLIPKEEG